MFCLVLRFIFIIKHVLPGITVYIYYKGKEKYINKGFQNIEKNIKLTNHSIWSTRSISKNIAATTVAWLVTQEKTSFDTKINNVQDIKFANDYIAKNISIKNALSHTTGLPSVAGVFESTYNYDLDFMYKTIQHYPLSGFNEVLNYNNLAYTMGFDTARKESGYKDINQAILEFANEIGIEDPPLAGMTHTTINTSIPDKTVVMPYKLINNHFVPLKIWQFLLNYI